MSQRGAGVGGGVSGRARGEEVTHGRSWGRGPPVAADRPPPPAPWRAEARRPPPSRATDSRVVRAPSSGRDERRSPRGGVRVPRAWNVGRARATRPRAARTTPDRARRLDRDTRRSSRGTRRRRALCPTTSAVLPNASTANFGGHKSFDSSEESLEKRRRGQRGALSASARMGVRYTLSDTAWRSS